MKLLTKFDLDNIVKAVSDISGYTEFQLTLHKKHAYTAWVHLGIYAARDMGASIEDAGKAFNRLIPTGHACISKVSAEVKAGNEEVIDMVKAIQDRVRSMR